MSATDDLLAARGEEYGDFGEMAKRVTMLFRAVDLDLQIDRGGPEVVVLAMICVKLARLAHDPHHLDSLRDIVGYCTLMLRELEK